MRRALLLVLALFLVACGSPSSTDTDTPAPDDVAEATAVVEPTDEPEPTDPPTEEPTEEPTPEPLTATRDAPLALGEEAVLEATDGGTIRVSVLEVQTGDAALATVKAANMFNDDPGQGQQYVLARVKAVVEPPVPDAFTKWDPSVFSLVAAGRAIDDDERVTGLEPRFEGEILPPGEIEGWVAWLAPATDDMSVVLLRTLDRGGWWFATQ